MNKELSIVIPVYKGAATVGRVVQDILASLADELLEIVLVNDGSPDDSGAVCARLVREHAPLVRYVELARNFSEHNADMAGLSVASGAYVVLMDDDSQNPASEVRTLLTEIRRGYDVVYSQYARKQHHWFRNLGSRFNDRVATLMLGKPPKLYLSSFKILNRFVVDELTRYRNPHPYIDGLILQTTRNIGQVEVAHRARADGHSNYTLHKLVGLWMSMFINFSIVPLRVAGGIGFLMALCGLILGGDTVIEKWNNPAIPLGYASLIVSILVIGGIQCFLLGMLGEYLGRLFLTINQKPQFVIRRKLGWE